MAYVNIINESNNENKDGLPSVLPISNNNYLSISNVISMTRKQKIMWKKILQ